MQDISSAKKSPLLSGRPHFYLKKNLNAKQKRYILPKVMIVNVSIFYQNFSAIRSKVYYSNTRCQFCMTSALISLRPILHLRESSKHFT